VKSFPPLLIGFLFFNSVLFFFSLFANSSALVFRFVSFFNAWQGKASSKAKTKA